MVPVWNVEQIPLKANPATDKEMSGSGVRRPRLHADGNGKIAVTTISRNAL
jgi:hypothetical protein